MVFSRLSAQEKEAFFGLLDEYFQSRPEIFGQGNGVTISPAAAASVVRMAASAAGTSSGTKSNNPYTAMSTVDVGRVASLAAGHARSYSAAPPSEVDKLVTAKSSVLSAFKKQGAPGAVAIPPAFSAPRASAFGPPPVRRGASEQPPEPAPASEPAGEWAEALYDYSSEDPGDLSIMAGARVLVTARSSEDWWTGRVQGQGKEGLFPASYVKLV